MKGELADVVADQENGARQFSPDDLKKLFNLDLETRCSTRDIMRNTPAYKGWQVSRTGAGLFRKLP